MEPFTLVGLFAVYFLKKSVALEKEKEKNEALKKAFDALQEVVSRNQTIAAQHSHEIAYLKRQYAELKIDKAELEERVRKLIAKIQRDSGAKDAA